MNQRVQSTQNNRLSLGSSNDVPFTRLIPNYDKNGRQSISEKELSFSILGSSGKTSMSSEPNPNTNLYNDFRLKINAIIGNKMNPTEVVVQASYTIDKLKDIIYESLKIEKKDQILNLQRESQSSVTLIIDERTLHSYKIKENSVLYLLANESLITINISINNNSVIQLDKIKRYCTISDLKSRIADVIKIPIDRIELKYKNKQLENHMILYDYGITNNSTIFLDNYSISTSAKTLIKTKVKVKGDDMKILLDEFELEVDNSISILKYKEILAQKFNLNNQLITLEYQNQKLSNSTELRTLNILNGETLFLRFNSQEKLRLEARRSEISSLSITDIEDYLQYECENNASTEETDTPGGYVSNYYEIYSEKITLNVIIDYEVQDSIIAIFNIAKVKELKCKICKQFSLNYNDLILMYAGEILLDDNQSIYLIGCLNGSDIH